MRKSALVEAISAAQSARPRGSSSTSRSDARRPSPHAEGRLRRARDRRRRPAREQRRPSDAADTQDETARTSGSDRDAQQRQRRRPEPAEDEQSNEPRQQGPGPRQQDQGRQPATRAASTTSRQQRQPRTANQSGQNRDQQGDQQDGQQTRAADQQGQQAASKAADSATTTTTARAAAAATAAAAAATASAAATGAPWPQRARAQINEDDVLIPVAGILDLLDNYAFVRTTGYLPGSERRLRRRCRWSASTACARATPITGAVKQTREGERKEKFNPLVRIDTVNGAEPEAAKRPRRVRQADAAVRAERLRLETEPTNLTTRLIDIVAPIGKGQRGLIVSPSKAGKTLSCRRSPTRSPPTTPSAT